MTNQFDPTAWNTGADLLDAAREAARAMAAAPAVAIAAPWMVCQVRGCVSSQV